MDTRAREIEKNICVRLLEIKLRQTQQTARRLSISQRNQRKKHTRLPKNPFQFAACEGGNLLLYLSKITSIKQTEGEIYGSDNEENEEILFAIN
jgi:hypothetical protein